MPAPSPPRELAVGEIARRAGSLIHRVEYVIRSRGIRPVRVAGNCRIFSEEDARRIIADLEAIDAKRAGK